jgi:hypothetical protein
MFILDSLFFSGFRWVLDTIISAAEAELNDDTALREELMNAEMRRELGEISNAEFAELEADLLARIREIKERREGGSGSIAFGSDPMEMSGDTRYAVEATVSGDFHEPSRRPIAFEAEPVTAGDTSGTVIQGALVEPRRPARTDRAARRKRTGNKQSPSKRTRTARTSRTSRSSRSARKIR